MTFTPTKPHYDSATKTFIADEPVTDPDDGTYAVQVPPEADASGETAFSGPLQEPSPIGGATGGALEAEEDPTNTAVPTFSGTETSTHVLTATSGTWTKPAHQPAITYAYQWYSKTGSTYTSLGTANGANTNAYTIQAGDIGKKLRVTVTATSGDSSNTANSADSGTIAS